jgi:hypothetical protein
MGGRGERSRPWSAVDVSRLESMITEQLERHEIAAQLDRTEHAVQAKVAALRRQQGTSAVGVGRRGQRRSNRASFFLS